MGGSNPQTPMAAIEGVPQRTGFLQSAALEDWKIYTDENYSQDDSHEEARNERSPASPQKKDKKRDERDSNKSNRSNKSRKPARTEEPKGKNTKGGQPKANEKKSVASKGDKKGDKGKPSASG